MGTFCFSSAFSVLSIERETMKVTMANTNMTTCSKLRTSSLAQAGARRCVAVRAASNNSNNQAAASAENENQQAVTRRAVVGLFAGAAVLAGKAQPSLAAYERRPTSSEARLETSLASLHMKETAIPFSFLQSGTLPRSK